MLDESFMSFLGVGLQPPLASWGTLISEAAALINPIKLYWWMLVFPGGMMTLTLLALNFLGDGLRDALDPAQPWNPKVAGPFFRRRATRAVARLGSPWPPLTA